MVIKRGKPAIMTNLFRTPRGMPGVDVLIVCYYL